MASHPRSPAVGLMGLPSGRHSDPMSASGLGRLKQLGTFAASTDGLMDAEVTRVAFMGSFLPRKCGIATFTHDLQDAVATRYEDEGLRVGVVAMNDTRDG